MGIVRRFKFDRDNEPKHKSRLVQEHLLYNCLYKCNPLTKIQSKISGTKKNVEFIKRLSVTKMKLKGRITEKNNSQHAKPKRRYLPKY